MKIKCKDNYMKLKELLERFKGKKNSNYQPDINKLTPRAERMRQEVKRGSASKYKCKKCGSRKNMEWAHIGPHKMIPLCKSCHSKLDKKQENFK